MYGELEESPGPQLLASVEVFLPSASPSQSWLSDLAAEDPAVRVQTSSKDPGPPLVASSGFLL